MNTLYLPRVMPTNMEGMNETAALPSPNPTGLGFLSSTTNIPKEYVIPSAEKKIICI